MFATVSQSFNGGNADAERIRVGRATSNKARTPRYNRQSVDNMARHSSWTGSNHMDSSRNRTGRPDIHKRLEIRHRCQSKHRHVRSQTYPCGSRPIQPLCARCRCFADGARYPRRDRGRRQPARARQADRAADAPRAAGSPVRRPRARRAALNSEWWALVAFPSCLRRLPWLDSSLTRLNGSIDRLNDGDQALRQTVSRKPQRRV